LFSLEQSTSTTIMGYFPILVQSYPVIIKMSKKNIT